MKNARLPSAQEITEIAYDLVRLHQLDAKKFNFLEGLDNKDLYEDALSVLEGRTILITDKYESDCPSYCGKTGVIFWGEVCFISILVVDQNKKLRIMDNETIEILGGTT